MKKLICVVGLMCLANLSLAWAEDQAPLQVKDAAVYFDQLRAEFRGNKAALLEELMDLSEAEAPVFWRVYGEYEQELIALNDKRLSALKDYLDNFDKMTAKKAAAILSRHFTNQRARLDLRQKYAGKISRLLSPLVALRFVHVDAEISVVIEAELLSQLPLAEKAPAQQ
jgi:hypothetical protein